MRHRRRRCVRAAAAFADAHACAQGATLLAKGYGLDEEELKL
jgi:hypothetical protein